MIDFENLLKQSKVYSSIVSDRDNGILNHCIMIISEDGIACNNMCLIIARALLCKNNNCGKCKSCMDVENGVHSALISPNSLNVEGIKDLIPKCFYSIDGEIRVVLIQDFQDIAPREQNRLLKLFEEPIENTVFILGVTKPSNVLDTIKSRSTKMILESFSSDQIKVALKEKYDDDYAISKAVDFSEGSLTKAVDILASDSFMDCYETMINVMIEMKNTSMMLDMIAKMNIKFLKQYLDMLEVIIKQLIEIEANQASSTDERLIKLSKEYNIPTLVNIEDLVVGAKQKLEQFCKDDGVLSMLLMGILEVKYKCR